MNDPPFTVSAFISIYISAGVLRIQFRIVPWDRPIKRELVRLGQRLVSVDFGKMIAEIMLLGRVGFPGIHVDLQIVAVLSFEYSIRRDWKDSGRVRPKARLNEFFIESIDAAGVSTHEFIDILLVDQ